MWLCPFLVLYASSRWHKTRKPTGTRLNRYYIHEGGPGGYSYHIKQKYSSTLWCLVAFAWVSRQCWPLRMGCNLSVILVILVATLVTYGIEQAGGVKMQKIGKVPRGFQAFQPWSMPLNHFTELVCKACLE